MTEKKSFTRGDVRGAVNGILAFLDAKKISSIRDLRSLNETGSPIGYNGHITVIPTSSGSLNRAATIDYRINGNQRPVLEARIGDSPYGGHFMFRCNEEIKGYHHMPRRDDAGNIIHERVRGSFHPRDLRLALEELLGKTRIDL